MKNLATCKPSEFVAQTAKIKGAVSDWMKAIDFAAIRASKPTYEVLPLDATPEQRAEVIKKNAEIQQNFAMQKVSKLLDNMLAEHPQETLNVLALCCFVEPEHVDDYSIDEYFQCIMDMLQNKSILDFFSLLAQIQTPKSI